MVSVLALRKVSAWALPRASAIASAKLAKMTVNQSQMAICRVKPMAWVWVTASRMRKMVVRAAPTSTTNITGFLISVAGLSLTNDSRSARLTMGGSKSGRARTSFLGMSCGSSMTGVGGVATVAMSSTPDREQHHREELPLLHQEMLHDGSQGQGREVCEG